VLAVVLVCSRVRELDQLVSGKQQNWLQTCTHMDGQGWVRWGTRPPRVQTTCLYRSYLSLCLFSPSKSFLSEPIANGRSLRGGHQVGVGIQLALGGDSGPNFAQQSCGHSQDVLWCDRQSATASGILNYTYFSRLTSTCPGPEQERYLVPTAFVYISGHLLWNGQAYRTPLLSFDWGRLGFFGCSFSPSSRSSSSSLPSRLRLPSELVVELFRVVQEAKFP